MNSYSSDILISILMPAKNAEAYLVECIQSIFDQTYEHWELIVVNDHSSDHSNAILMQFCETDQRICVLQNNGHGIISALRLAYAHSSGQLITRMDADDIMTPQKLVLLSSALTAKGKGFVAVGGVRYFSADGIGNGYTKYAAWLNKLTYSSTNFSEIYKECVVPSPCWMIHRQDLDACGAFNSDIYPEDYDLCFRFYKAGFNITGVNNIIHLWRDYSTRSSRTDEHYADNRFLDLKINYFLELDCNIHQQLILWGAGKKGKLIAKQLIKKGILFKWITNNPNKIGRDIYDQLLFATENFEFNSDHQLIISVSNPAEQSEILRSLKESIAPPSIFLFC